MNNTFKKDKLNNGCIVQIRDKDKYIVLKDAKNGTCRKEDVLVNIKTGSLLRLSDYNDNLKEKNGYSKFDIIKFCNFDYVRDNFKKHIIDKKEYWTAERNENEEDLEEIMEEIKVKTKELNEIMKRYEELKEVE